ncbi:small integral membrane protein 8 [Egretta garzetta]|nr:small integral membrane protein 8 [Egretta garzetta]
MTYIFHSVFRKYSTLIKMSSTKPPNEKETPKAGKPGLRIFFGQNKPVMAFGLVAVTLCVAYLGYLHATVENKKDLYEAIDSEGSRYMRRKTSKWD